MRTPASIAGHPIHPILVAIPIGLWLFSLACDLSGLFSESMDWSVVALYTMAGGVIGAILAAIPGMIDMLSLSGKRKKVALTHMTLNLIVVALYLVNFGIRWQQSATSTTSSTPLILSVVAVALLGVSGWLGGKMVYVQGVAVDVEEPDHAGVRRAAG